MRVSLRWPWNLSSGARVWLGLHQVTGLCCGCPVFLLSFLNLMGVFWFIMCSLHNALPYHRPRLAKPSHRRLQSPKCDIYSLRNFVIVIEKWLTLTTRRTEHELSHLPDCEEYCFKTIVVGWLVWCQWVTEGLEDRHLSTKQLSTQWLLA